MTRDELLNIHESLCYKARELMKRKNADYAGNGGKEPFANFTRVEAMGVCETKIGMMVRMIDKISRLSSFLENGKFSVEDEGLVDTIMDIINYCVLFYAYEESKKPSTVKAKPEPELLILNEKTGFEDLTDSFGSDNESFTKDEEELLRKMLVSRAESLQLVKK